MHEKRGLKRMKAIRYYYKNFEYRTAILAEEDVIRSMASACMQYFQKKDYEQLSNIAIHVRRYPRWHILIADERETHLSGKRKNFNHRNLAHFIIKIWKTSLQANGLKDSVNHPIPSGMGVLRRF